MGIYEPSYRIQYAPTDEGVVYYPESDGEPIAETDFHLDLTVRTMQKLKAYFVDSPDVYISANMLVCDVPGKPQRSISPDVLVSFGGGKEKRCTYKIWEEGKPPDFVLEFASKSTFENDLGWKKTRYAELRVKDYLLCDFERCYLPEPLMGFRLGGDGDYLPIPPLADAGILSAALGIEFHLEGDALGLYDPILGQWLKTPAEIEAAARQQAETVAQQEASARQQAEAEVARLRAELDRLKGEKR